MQHLFCSIFHSYDPNDPNDMICRCNIEPMSGVASIRFLILCFMDERGREVDSRDDADSAPCGRNPKLAALQSKMAASE